MKLVSKVIPFNQKMMGARSCKGHCVGGKFKAGLAVFMDDRLELASGDITVSFSKCRNTMRLKEPFGELIKKDTAKWDKHMSTHGKCNVLGLACAQSKFRLQLAYPMDRSSRVSDNKASTRECRLAEMRDVI